MRNLTKLKVLTSSLLVISTLTCFCLSSSFAASDSKDSVEEYDASKAKRELASMNDNDLENLKTKAIAEVKDKHLLNDH